MEYAMNARNVTAVLLLMAGLCSGCAMLCDYHTLPSGHYWPKREQWTVLPDTNLQHYTTSPLDFHAVYVNRSSDNWCHLYRLWPSGRVMLKNMPYPPTLDDVSSLKKSFLGYYVMENRRLVLETYGPAGSPATKGGYSRRVFEVTDKGLTKLSATFNGRNFQDFTTYEMKYRLYARYPIEGMKSEPFW